ncbi:MAG: formylglycine-generating enzyme family protein [Nitrosomonadales bacterium]|nr:formylglycine-generating enzyme family protein [Nitrosomonadales bacterium]
MTQPHIGYKSVVTVEERARRKRYLSATIVTCLVLAIIGGSVHVVQLGANRVSDMRNKATYDLKEESSRVRAAGEDVSLHKINEDNKDVVAGYTQDQIETLIPQAEWAELDQTVLITAGEFQMGTDLERADAQNHPQHGVQLGAYEIDKYPVTNAQYAKFVAATGHRPPLHWKDGKIPLHELKHPVTLVSWFDAAAYAKWANKRLPTEAEWEKAARGSDARRWPWGNTMEPTRLNTYYNVGSTTDVTRYPEGASPYGVMDMAGNVNEWTADDFKPYDGSKAPEDLFQGKVARAASDQDKALKVVDLMPVGGRYKVLRGGSWKGDPFSTATFHRNYAWPNYASDFFGFRCVRDVQHEGKKK